MGTRACPFCAEDIDDTACACRNCSLPVTPLRTVRKAPAGPSMAWIYVPTALMLFLIVLVSAGVFERGENQMPRTMNPALTEENFIELILAIGDEFDKMNDELRSELYYSWLRSHLSEQEIDEFEKLQESLDFEREKTKSEALIKDWWLERFTPEQVFEILNELYFNAKHIYVGSSKETVLSIQGEPDKVESSPNWEIWVYGNSYIRLRLVSDSVWQVHGWQNPDNNLKVLETQQQ